MEEINQMDIKHAIHNHYKSSHSSVLFENVWGKYSDRKIRHKHKRIYRKGIIAACTCGLLCFIGLFQTPVLAFIEQFIEVKLIKNVKNAEIGFSWANAAGDTRSVVSNKEEAEKLLGYLFHGQINWKECLGKRKFGLEKKGISH